MKFIKDIKTFLNETYIEPQEENPQQFQYMMLSRLQSDCEYFLNYGRGREKDLWAGNIIDHIAKMKSIWNELEIKPEWLSYEDILKYEENMLNYSEM